MDTTYKTTARENMLKSQILTGHVLDPRILDALLNVAREDFVPPVFAGSAYADREIPLGNGRFMLEPLDFARMLKYAGIGENETVLDIGCGSGYSAAVMSKMARRVVALEEEQGLADTAVSKLSAFPNVSFVKGPLVEGARLAAPYDVIVIEGAIEYLPEAIADQLREGGRLVTGEHDAGSKVGVAGLSKLLEYRKLHGKLQKTVLHDATLALLAAFVTPPSFTF